MQPVGAGQSCRGFWSGMPAPQHGRRLSARRDSPGSGDRDAPSLIRWAPVAGTERNYQS